MSRQRFTQEEIDIYASLCQAILDDLTFCEENEPSAKAKGDFKKYITTFVTAKSQLPESNIAEEIESLSRFNELTKALVNIIKAEKNSPEKKRSKSKKQVDLQLFSDDESENPLKIIDKIDLNLFSAEFLERSFNHAFTTIIQGTATNSLTKLNPKKGKNTKVDALNQTITFSEGNFSLTVPYWEELPSLRTSTHQLLDFLTIAFTESNSENPLLVIPIKEYMKMRGLKDRKEATIQASADMKILSRAQISGEEKRGEKTIQYGFINLADCGNVQKGKIYFKFGDSFAKKLRTEYNIMPYPVQLLAFNNHRNPNSYYFLRKISELKNMNVGKPNEDIVSVKTLLSVAQYIPSYEEVMSGNKNTYDRIIVPFERDMDALSETFEWTYCHSNNTPLTEYEANNMPYAIFKDLLIKVDWKNYPDQTARLERKAERNKKRSTAKRNPKSTDKKE